MVSICSCQRSALGGQMNKLAPHRHPTPPSAPHPKKTSTDEDYGNNKDYSPVFILLLKYDEKEEKETPLYTHRSSSTVAPPAACPAWTAQVS